MIAGIDISHWQGAIDWPRVKATQAIGFVYIKATDGQFGIDPAFDTNWKNSEVAAIPRGAYHFYRPVDVDSQVRSLIAALGDDPGELPPALDVEVGAMDRPQWENVLLWLEAIEAHYKRPPLLYLDLAAIGQLKKASGLAAARAQSQVTAGGNWLARFTHFRLWLADYSGAAAPPPVDPWSTWTFWQHTPQGSTPGLKAAVDLDYFVGDDLKASWPLAT
jgi:lysozyme